MIGTELQEFQKWLEYCDFTELKSLAPHWDAQQRRYAVKELDGDGYVYTFDSTGAACEVEVYFDENGFFQGFRGEE